MRKEQIIKFFEEGNKPLTQDLIDSLEENLDYAAFTGICRICRKEELVIAPIVTLDNLECSSCGNFTMEPALPDEELEVYQLDNFNEHRFFVR